MKDAKDSKDKDGAEKLSAAGSSAASSSHFDDSDAKIGGSSRTVKLLTKRLRMTHEAVDQVRNYQSDAT